MFKISKITNKLGLTVPELSDTADIISAVSDNMEKLDNSVPDSRTINGKSLEEDIVLNTEDIEGLEEFKEYVKEIQRYQDYEIQALKEQLNTGFTGITETHTFDSDQLPQWKGFDGTGLPEGILDTVQRRIYL